LGILGGGQLGKMLLYETRKWDIFTRVMDPSGDAPARLGCNEFVVGDLMSFEQVYDFGKDLDTLTIEIEHVNTAALEQLKSEGVKVYPDPKMLRTIQNKSSQKLFFLDHEIPTAPFHRFAYTSEVADSLENGGIRLPFVWKSTQMGYDGRGVKIVRQEKDLQGLPNVECLVEELVSFKKELAVLVARNPSGAIEAYPPVEMEFHPEANQVQYVICPAHVDEAIAKKAMQLAVSTAEKFGLVGLLAVEMFQTVEDEIWVNEVAPRPHNSGHFSLEASYTNQYEQHLRAILDLPLGNTQSKGYAVMVNLVGEPGFEGDVYYEGMEKVLAMPGVTPHIYGKRQTRPFRKMGHITILNPKLSKALDIAREVYSTVRVVTKEHV